MLKSTPNVRKSPRSGLNLEGRLSDPQIFFLQNRSLLAHRFSRLTCTWSTWVRFPQVPRTVRRDYSRSLGTCFNPPRMSVKPLILHLVDVGSIPTGSTHGEGRLQLHPGDVLKSTPNVRRSPRSGLNLEGRLSDPQIFNVVSWRPL